MDGDYLGGVGDKAVGQLGDMHQSVLLNADIDEATKVRDVRDDAGEHHPLAQVVQRFDRRVEGKDLDGLPRVAPRLVQLLHDIEEGWHSYLIVYIRLQAECLLLLLVLDKL